MNASSAPVMQHRTPTISPAQELLVVKELLAFNMSDELRRRGLDAQAMHLAQWIEENAHRDDLRRGDWEDAFLTDRTFDDRYARKQLATVTPRTQESGPPAVLAQRIAAELHRRDVAKGRDDLDFDYSDLPSFVAKSWGRSDLGRDVGRWSDAFLADLSERSLVEMQKSQRTGYSTKILRPFHAP
jgi:hypothetical protein